MENKKPHEQGVCPICGSLDLDYGSIELDGRFLGYTWHCCSCKSTGTEWHSLTFLVHAGVEEWIEGEEGAEFEQEN